MNRLNYLQVLKAEGVILNCGKVTKETFVHIQEYRPWLSTAISELWGINRGDLGEYFEKGLVTSEVYFGAVNLYLRRNPKILRDSLWSGEMYAV